MAEPSVIINYPKKPLVIKDQEDGWAVDIRLSIVNISENTTSTVYKAISTYNGQELGFILSIPKLKTDGKSFGKGIILKSTGTQSDNLLQKLANLYKVNADSTLRFAPEVAVTYVDLKEFAKRMSAKNKGGFSPFNQYKLFFKDEVENVYAEIYLNVNARDHWIELCEKDEEYRPAVISFLKKQ